MVIGAGCYCFLWHQSVAGWLFLVGSVMFAMMQCMQTYEGTSVTIRRLRRMMMFADVLFVVSGILMVDGSYSFLQPFFGSGNGYINYIVYVKNKWVLLLLIAAILEVFSIHRISHELARESRQEEADNQI